jgi:predicted DNA-binding transcriptional regulator YafY
LREYFGNAWAVYRGEESYQVKLRFTPEAAKVVTETIWHHTQTETKHTDGSVTLEFTVDGLKEILNMILSWAGRVKVQQPEQLKNLYVNTLQDAIKMTTKE